MNATPYLGEILALLTAVTWALAVILFKKSGESVHPIGLNTFKNVLSTALLVPTGFLLGESILREAPLSDYVLLLASGALGIGIADTLFFHSLNALGAGRSAIVDCLYSPFTIVLSILFLGESLTLWQFAGVAMIVSAVLSAVGEKKESNGRDRKRILLGFFWGAISMACMAVGVVMVKPLLAYTPLIWATTMRLIGGLTVLAVVLAFHPRRNTIVGSLRAAGSWVYTISGSFMGAYLSMVLWLAGMKYTQASTASALNQMSNIFIFVFAAWLLKEKITLIRTIAILMGVGGALLVTFG
ncbi:MAG: DMT family transporter [candidate division Zixibacteria bacterium]|nr:DMT family transporter [candidate division Zixibacteria bacterium]